MLSSTSDIELWNAAAQGSREAFNEVFRRQYPLLYQYGRKICHDSSTLEDCIQELFTELWQKKKTPPVRSVRAYLLQILKYKLYKAFRSQRRWLHTLPDGAEPFELSPEAFLVHSEEDAEKGRRVLEALSRLPARQKEIVYLKIYKGLSYEEAGEVMQLNYQVVRNLLSQALKTFRRLVSLQSG